jgi:alkyl hydroperoxide reductase subunit F
VIEQIKALDADMDFEVYMSLSCHNCPDVVQAFSLMSILNPRIKTTVIDGGMFQKEIEAREIMGVPSVFPVARCSTAAASRWKNSQKVDTGAAKRDAEKLSARAPMSADRRRRPGRAAAAIYTARKGIRTGIVTERLAAR